MTRQDHRTSNQPGTGLTSFLRASWPGGWLPGLLLVAGTLLAYQPVWHAGFVWDDDVFLVNNPLIHAADGLYRFWFTLAPTDYFPMTSTLLWLEWRVWGSHPLGYHLVNVLLHALNAVLLWRVLLSLLPRCQTGAWLAAALFAVHPVNVQSVAWITEGKNTLAMTFYALTLLGYLRFENTGRQRWYWAALALFVLALLSKAAVVGLPLVLLGLAGWRRGRIDRRDVWRSLPFFAAAALVGLLAIGFQLHRNVGAGVVRADDFWSRLAGAGWAVWFYLGKALAPVDLIPVYPRWRINPANPISFVPGLLLVAVFWVGWRQRRTWGRALLFGLGYFVVMLLPVLGFLNIYFMRYSLVADHWQYFSILGPLALVAVGMTRGWGALDRIQPLARPALGGLLLLVLGLLTWRQAGVYRDATTLWRTTLERNPRCFLAHNNLGNALLDQGQVDEAIGHFQSALDIQPDFAPAQNSLGNSFLGKGQVDEAIAHYQKAIELQPDYAAAHNNLANTLLQAGRVAEAIAHYQAALNLRPDSPEMQYNLANALLENGQVDPAIAHYRMALQLKPAFPEAASHLLYIAWVLATSPQPAIRNGARAVELALQAERHSDRNDPVVPGTLAAAYAEAGQLAEAVAAGQRALALATAQNNVAMANTLRAQIGLYQQGQSYRDAGLTNAPVSPARP